MIYEKALDFVTKALGRRRHNTSNGATQINIFYALIIMFNREINSGLAAGKFGADAAKILLDQYRDFDRILGSLDVDASINAAPATDDTPAEVLELIEKRTAAKKAKNWAEADAIRDQLKALGYAVVDTPAGPKAEKLA